MNQPNKAYNILFLLFLKITLVFRENSFSINIIRNFEKKIKQISYHIIQSLEDTHSNNHFFKYQKSLFTFMGSVPTSGDGDKKLINVVQIKTPESNNKENHEFKTSIDQMKVILSLTKFSKRNDIFKQKSDETKMQLNNALQSLKKNHLLSTIEFKKLQKTQNLTTNSNSKKRSSIKHERYEYKPNGNKYSEQNLAIVHKKQKNSKDISSISSTYINECNQINQKEALDVKKTIQAQVLAHLLNRKKGVSSQNSNRKYKNILDPAEVETFQDLEAKYENGKANQRKKSKYIKSQKFIPRQFVPDSEFDFVDETLEN